MVSACRGPLGVAEIVILGSRRTENLILPVRGRAEVDHRRVGARCLSGTDVLTG